MISDFHRVLPRNKHYVPCDSYVCISNRFAASGDELDITLGDDSISSCDLTQTATVESAVNHNCGDRFVCANNSNLQNKLSIKYVVPLNLYVSL